MESILLGIKQAQGWKFLRGDHKLRRLKVFFWEKMLVTKFNSRMSAFLSIFFVLFTDVMTTNNSPTHQGLQMEF